MQCLIERNRAVSMQLDTVRLCVLPIAPDLREQVIASVFDTLQFTLESAISSVVRHLHVAYRTVQLGRKL